MLSSRFNPFTWDTSAERVQSKVVSLQMKDDQGNSISVSNLKKDIEITLPLSPRENRTNSSQFFIKPSFGEKMQYHSFWMEYQETSAFVQIKVFVVIEFVISDFVFVKSRKDD
mgnify:CR=1 FL=1